MTNKMQGDTITPKHWIVIIMDIYNVPCLSKITPVATKKNDNMHGFNLFALEAV